MSERGSRGFTTVLALLAALAAASAALGPAMASPAVPDDLDPPLVPTSAPASSPPSAPEVQDPGEGLGQTARGTGEQGGSLLAALADAAGAVAAGLGAVAGGAGAAAGVLLDGLGALAGAIGWVLGALAGGLAWALGALAGGIAWLAGALAGLLVWLGGALAGLAVALATLLADLLVGAGNAAYDHPQAAAPVAAGAASAGALAWLARAGKLAPLLGLPLFSRLADHELLANRTRKAIYAFIQRHPGAHISQINQEMGIGWGTTVYHLNRLRDARLITVRKVGNQLCHFVNGQAGSADDQRRLAATKTPKAQAIVQYLVLRGPSPQHAIAEELGMSSALVSWHAKRLEDHGVVERVRSGRTSTLVLREDGPGQAAPARGPGADAAPTAPAGGIAASA